MKALVKQHFLLKEPAASARARLPARLEKPNTSPALSLISFKHLPKLSNILRTIALTSTRSSSISRFSITSNSMNTRRLSSLTRSRCTRKHADSSSISLQTDVTTTSKLDPCSASSRTLKISSSHPRKSLWNLSPSTLRSFFGAWTKRGWPISFA